MRRRDFISGLGGTALLCPLCTEAQADSLPVIGLLTITSPGATPAIPSLLRGVAEEGFVDGRNLTVEYRFAEYHVERLPALAAELAQRQVSLIAAVSGLPSILAAKAATTTIPIVFVADTDPVALGLVTSLNHPGGNLTGLAFLESQMIAKRIEMIHQILPETAPVAVLLDPSIEAAEIEAAVLAAGRSLRRRIVIAHATTPEDFEAAFVRIAREKDVGLAFTYQTLFVTNHPQLAALAARYGIPAIYGPANLAASGGLMSYGADVLDLFQQVGNIAGKILAGAKPAELPVQQPAKIGLKINLKTAKALGLVIPPTLLARADELIE